MTLRTISKISDFRQLALSEKDFDKAVVQDLTSVLGPEQVELWLSSTNSTESVENDLGGPIYLPENEEDFKTAVMNHFPELFEEGVAFYPSLFSMADIVDVTSDTLNLIFIVTNNAGGPSFYFGKEHNVDQTNKLINWSN